ncbi:hypothetical protein LSTR_LSTR006851 [Laodelphax striatellus]|uniref:Cilia- and flagella-associated protein 47 domain-containing protein n=1 Tax=Laodelphax striatellus TaxID=195883 RepID=A0A482XG07_LAOST|nr:hypothetical protein LSTR_LSTR006851 [Laodelphax striatellus]
MFSVEPSEGRIAPFEEFVLKIIYKPSIELEEKGWKYIENDWMPKSHFCFMKIVMVDVKDHIDFDYHEPELLTMQSSSSIKIDSNYCFEDEAGKNNRDSNLLSYDSANFTSTQGFRLCLHGLFTTPTLEVSPGCLVFDDLRLGASGGSRATVANRSLLTLGCRAVKQSYVQVTPELLFVEAGCSVHIEVNVCAHASGPFKRVVILECLSMGNVTDSSGLKVVGETKFIVEGDVKADSTKPQPKLNLGITPKITHEVGFLSEEVTFGSRNVQMPTKAIVPVKGQLPKMYNESDVVAFPNDMPKSLQAHYPEKVFRSIFTGKERYVPPVDCCLTYTLPERLEKNKHNEFWLNYMRNAFKKHQTYEKNKMKFDHGWNMKVMQRLNAVAPLDRLIPYERRISQSQPKCNALSPLELYNIRVTPRMLNFNLVAVDTDCEELLYVENLNNFAVTVRLISTNSSIKVNGNNQLKINPHAKVTFSIIIHSSVLGLFNGMFKYVINEKHMFEMIVAAEIVDKFLDIITDTATSTLEVRHIEPKNNPFYMWSEYITLKNRLKSDTAFSWTSKSFRCFDIVPKKGTVPSKGELNCAITYRPAAGDVEASSKISLQIGNNLVDTVKCFSTLGKVQTTFINPLLNLGSVPLNLEVVAKSVLFNASYRRVPFAVRIIVDDSLQGVSVSPTSGFVESRADVVFTFKFTLMQIGPVDFRVAVESENTTAWLKVVGQVVFPEVSITPEKFQWVRVPCFTHTVSMLTAANHSTAIATVSFLIDQYHHFKISLSSEYTKSNTIDSFTLLPGATKDFYLHFSPTDLVTHQFYLPIIINNIIGPPDINIAKTQSPGHFINQFQEMTKTISSEKLPCILILCTVSPPPLTFSKVFVKCFGVDEEDIVITNNQDTTAYVGLKLSSSNPVEKSFSFRCLATTIFVDNKDHVYFYEIEPKESINLTVFFNPSVRGFFEEKVLVFLTSDRDEVSDVTSTHEPHTKLILHGKSTGDLLASDSILIFRDTSGGQVAVTVIATADNCLLTTHAFSLVKYRAQADAVRTNATQTEAIQYSHVEFVKRSTSVTSLVATSSLEFNTKSGLDRRAIKSQTSLLGSKSSSYTPTHQDSSILSHTKNVKYQKLPWQSIPEFPTEQDPAPEYTHMINVRTAMENYLYGEIFNCCYHWTIGENIKWSSAYKPAEHGAALTNINFIKSLVELLERFCGRDIHTVLPYINIPFPKDEESRVLKVVSLLESVIEYLMKLGACLGHLSPEELLDYHDYDIYSKKTLVDRQNSIDYRKSSIGNFEIIRNPENISKEKYERRSVQCWLDLFLQLYKVCVLSSIKHSSYKPEDLMPNSKDDVNNKNTSFKLILKDKKSTHKTGNLNIKKMSDPSKVQRLRVGSCDRCQPETILLTWLYDFYVKQRKVVWPSDPPKLKSLDFFDSLSDSLVFAAVTSYYCPYISSTYFESMFTQPKGTDQLYHNAIWLLKAWNNIRLGLFVHASELIDDSNCILKLMISVHLFKFLPSYAPETVLDFGTPLTTFKERPITLRNNSLSPANYFLIMIGDPYRSFIVQSASNVINIKSKSTVVVNIQYTSNKIEKESATILFCGSCISPHFATTRVFTLVGYAEKLKISKVFHLEAPLNRIVDRAIKLNAPYGTYMQEYEFDLFYSENKPSVDNSQVYNRWIEVSNRKLPQRIHFPHASLVIPGKGRKFKDFSIKICCFTPKQYDYYFILMNPSVGDFIIQISIKPKVYVVKEPIQFQFKENVCSFANYKEQYINFWTTKTTPNAIIRIPYRNNDLWSSLMTMFELKFNANEKSFWTSYLETNIGLKLIQWMMGNESDSMTDDIRHIFKTSVSYKVTCSSRSLIVPTTLYLPDVMDQTEFREFGHALVDYIIHYRENIRERNVYPSVEPGYLYSRIPTEMPQTPDSWQNVLNDVETHIMPGITHWQSPRFHAYFPTASSYPSILGEMLAASLGIMGFSWITSPACTELEVVMMNWLGKLIGLPSQFLNCSEGPGGGIIQGSASEATLIGLLAAKEKTVHRLKQENPELDENNIRTKLVSYTSDQSNSSVEKAGLLASVPMRLLPANREGKLTGATLRSAILDDIKNGLIPCYVVATLGTTGTCAFDDLEELGPICQKHNLWLHVDAAYAGAAFICPEFQHLMAGVEYADSFDINCHKWMLVNFDCSAMWLKNTNDLNNAFNVDRLYLESNVTSHIPDFRHWQIPLGRRFRALKLWFTLRLYGVVGLQAHIRKHIKLANLFEEIVRKDDNFEIIVPAVMGLVGFRLKGDNNLTRQLLDKILLSRQLYMVPAIVNGQFIIRFVVCSEMTTEEDIIHDWQLIQKIAANILNNNNSIEKSDIIEVGEKNEKCFPTTVITLGKKEKPPKNVCIGK